jgi:hypothetical protein
VTMGLPEVVVALAVLCPLSRRRDQRGLPREYLLRKVQA